MGQLSQLQELSLKLNQLTSLPGELAHLAQLRELDLNYNPLTHLPPMLFQLSSLEELYLDIDHYLALHAELDRLRAAHPRLNVHPGEAGVIY